MPPKLIVSARRYQPLLSGTRDDAVASGAVASYFSANDAGAPFPALSKHVPLTIANGVSGPE